MLPAAWDGRLRLPVIAAPMTAVSGPDLVIAACASGVIGSFPTHNAPSVEVLEQWLGRIRTELGSADLDRVPAPVAANLIVHRSNARRDADLEACVRGGVELVIASVGSPKDVVAPLHDAGVLVYADVASLRHVDLASAAGVDGLVLLTAGAGGQTGWANPFAFVRAVRERYDGTIVLAGGISDGAGIAATEVLGADLAYLGTRFIATQESLASPEYRAAVVAATLDDITTSRQVSGLEANVLTSWLQSREAASDGAFAQDRLLAARDVWAAGHSVSGTDDVPAVADLVDRLEKDYQSARHPLGDVTASERY
ncbi:MAG: 2-nitropropane dioxygenase [Frankiales bacterium]|nr:2-nitropropane dioxygenase [Frankiales bacterium]